MDFVDSEIKQNDIRLILTNDMAHLNTKLLTELIISMMVRGVYCSQKLPNDEFMNLLENTLYSPSYEKIKTIKTELKNLYERNLAKYAKLNIVALVKQSLKNNTDIPGEPLPVK